MPPLPRPRLLATCLLLLLPLSAQATIPGHHTAPTHTHHTFTTEGDHFTLDGKPFKVISGELHYARIPRQYWHARLRMARAMGLNTVATYVFWNVHEPSPGHYNFSGNADLRAFLLAAQQEGLFVILRAGPYACAEWDLGGLPSWLLKPPQREASPPGPGDPRIPHPAPLRSTDPRFLVPADLWIHRLGHEVADLQVGRGGPILMTQIENEYGNFASDKAYMAHLHQTFLDAGFTQSLLYSADNWRNIAKGDLPGLLAATNFGIGNHAGGMDALARERPGAPLFVSEYWPGWFDHWGHPHETRPIPPQIEDVRYILDRGAGINIYMFHGGTSFGFMAGASWTGNQYLPDVTSYDYDAPLDESGRPTEKFFAFRKLLAQYTCATPASPSSPNPEACLPPIPSTPPTIAIPTITLTRSTPLWSHLPTPIRSQVPQTMEDLNQSFGYILYTTHLPSAITGDLTLTGLHDLATIYLDHKLVGTLDRRHDRLGPDHHPLPQSVPIATAGPANLDILVANDGRINSTGMMRSETEGLTGPVTLAGAPLTGWNIYPLPMSPALNLSTANSAAPHNAVRPQPLVPLGARFPHPELPPATPTAGTPTFRQATFTLAHTGDTFLDTSHLGKGAVWINGHPLGRFWNLGPQQTLYVPGPWLRVGSNQIVVFDMLPPNGPATVSGLDHPILNAPVTDETRSKQE